jgi:hypothetical protein
MKTWRTFAIIAVFGIMAGFNACDNETTNPVLCKCLNGTVHTNAPCTCGGEDCTCTYIPKVVEAIYCFTNGQWYDSTSTIVPEAISALGENTFTVSGGGVNISYSGIYTEGGSIFIHEIYGIEVSWAYLYSGSNKIGIVHAWKDSSASIEADLGKTYIDHLIPFLLEFGSIDTNGMQDLHNGFGFSYHP